MLRTLSAYLSQPPLVPAVTPWHVSQERNSLRCPLKPSQNFATVPSKQTRKHPIVFHVCICIYTLIPFTHRFPRKQKSTSTPLQSAGRIRARRRRRQSTSGLNCFRHIVPVAKKFPEESMPLPLSLPLDSLNCAYLCPFASGRPENYYVTCL